jgi:archaellum component FlaC
MSISGYTIEKITNYADRSILNSKINLFSDQIVQLNTKIEFLLEESKTKQVTDTVEKKLNYVEINDLNELIKDIESNLTELSLQFSSTPREIQGLKAEVEDLRNEMKALKAEKTENLSLSQSQIITPLDTDIKDVQTRNMSSIPRITIQKAVPKK